MEEVESKSYKLLIENLISETKSEFDRCISRAKEAFNYIEKPYRTSASGKISYLETIAYGFNEACKSNSNIFRSNGKEKYLDLQLIKHEYYGQFIKLFNEFEECYRNAYSNKQCLSNLRDKIDLLIKQANELFKSKEDYKLMKSKKSTSIVKIDEYNNQIANFIDRIELIKIELRNAIYFSDKDKESNDEEHKALMDIIMYYNMLILCRDMLISMYNSNISIFDKKFDMLKPFDKNNYSVLPEVIEILKNGVVVTKRRKLLEELLDSYILYEDGDIKDINNDNVDNIKYIPSKLAEHMKSLIISKLNEKLSMFELVIINKGKSIAESYFNDTCKNSSSISELLNYYVNIDEICNDAYEAYKKIVSADIYTCSYKYRTLCGSAKLSKEILDEKRKKNRVEMLNVLIELCVSLPEVKDNISESSEKEKNTNLIESSVFLLIQISKYDDQDGKLDKIKNFLAKYPEITISVFTSILSAIKVININTLSDKAEWASILSKFNNLKELYNKIYDTKIDENHTTKERNAAFLEIIINFLNLNIKSISRIASRLLVVPNNIEAESFEYNRDLKLKMKY